LGPTSSNRDIWNDQVTAIDKGFGRFQAADGPSEYIARLAAHQEVLTTLRIMVAMLMMLTNDFVSGELHAKAISSLQKEFIEKRLALLGKEEKILLTIEIEKDPAALSKLRLGLEQLRFQIAQIDHARAKSPTCKTCKDCT
jgi:hypothetical protein